MAAKQRERVDGPRRYDGGKRLEPTGSRNGLERLLRTAHVEQIARVLRERRYIARVDRDGMLQLIAGFGPFRRMHVRQTERDVGLSACAIEGQGPLRGL